MKKLALAAFALLMAASMSIAATVAQFKAGDISFSIFDKDGVSPLQSASVKVLDAASGDAVAEAVADELGQAVISLDAGRYLLNISDLNLAVFDVAAAEGLSACRVIMPDAALLVGGQDARDRDDGAGLPSDAGGTGLASWVVPAGIVAGAAILIGGTWAIIDHQQPSKTIGRHENVPAPEEQPKKHTTPSVHPAPTPTPTPSAT